MNEVTLSDGKKVTMREPKVRDMVMLDDVVGEKQKEIELISNLSQLTDDEILDMNLKDYGKLQGVVQSFLE